MTAAPTGQRLDPVPGEWRRVSPKYLVVDLVSTLIGGAIATAATALPATLFGWGVWWWLLPAAVALVSLVGLALTPRRVRSIGYRLRDDDLLFRRGIMFQRFVAVPFGRMQLVDITRGPIVRALGLAELKLVTAAASSGVVIPGLPLAEAEELRDHLVALAETRRAGL
ncbi:PH domain-containing protein [Protaetiibacter larvae]|uniref:PH domain-containing protein n=1 Tax=Protaetiibacter larvae TaxID=2592654 RepID=A0A5C1YCD5_9MICO|nr:PH domain-containing protein [Protaetiibacter larvae]